MGVFAGRAAEVFPNAFEDFLALFFALLRKRHFQVGARDVADGQMRSDQARYPAAQIARAVGAEGGDDAQKAGGNGINQPVAETLAT